MMLKFGYKNIIILCLMLLWALPSHASTSLDCQVTSYQQAINSGYDLEWAKSWVPERFDAEIDTSGIIRVGDYENSLISNNDKGEKIEFYINVPNRNDGAVIKGTYFKKKKKFAVKITYPVYRDSGLIWGECEEGTSTQASSSSSTSTETRKGWLGVFIQEITPEIADEFDLENDNGALVSLVNSGSPSEKAGIKAGDVIVTFNDKPIEEAFSLFQIIAESSIGKPIDVHIIRQGKKMNLKVTLVALEDAEEAGLLAGTTLSSEYNNINDFAVASKDADPFKKGDKVLRVGQVAVHNVEMFITEISEIKSSGRNTFLLLVDRDNRQRFVNVDFNILTSAFNYNFDMPLATASNLEQSTTPTSSELLAAQQEAEALKQQLAELQSQISSQTQQATSSDTQIPLITITRADTDDKQGIIAGRVSDNVGVAEVTVDGNVVPLMSNGSFEYSTYVPATGKTVEVQVTDLAGLSSSQTVTLERNVNLATASISFDELNPIAKPVKRNNNALALIIGVSDYKNTPAKAIFADSDAMMFHDYASEKLGIPDNRIKTLVNDGADEREMLLAVQSWLSRSVKQDQTDVYVFFAGHGLASDDGQNMYLLPYDGSPELLDRTAILRDELFSDIAKANPRSVTVFLDTCYSGSNRGSQMLIADARPILLKAKDTSVPEGFTVFTAAAGDETAKSLEEAKHGMFSYFLMKGMEGDADTNGDKQITAGELHTYVKSNVVQQSSGTQTPELQGDEDRVLVRFE